jgi:hypothetical protein
MNSGQPPRPPRWLKPVNRLTMAMSRLGVNLGDDKTMVLTVPGRKNRRPAVDAGRPDDHRW